MHTPIKSILLFLFAAILGAIGQYLFKGGAQVGGRNLLSWLLNWRIILGIINYTGVMLLFVYAFKLGGELTVLYPVYASTFIWALFIGSFVLKESISLYKIAGTLLIIFGIFLIAKH